jgi:hypothetical protein
MRNLLLAAIVFITGACTTGGGTRTESKVAEPPSKVGPRFGRIVTLYEVLDQDTQQRVGFVEFTSYDNGQDIYWVRDKARKEKLGYILTNNQGYRYDWNAGQRARKPEFIGADTISANTRLILRYGRPVELRETSLRTLARELEPAPQKTATEDAGSDEE